MLHIPSVELRGPGSVIMDEAEDSSVISNTLSVIILGEILLGVAGTLYRHGQTSVRLVLSRQYCKPTMRTVFSLLTAAVHPRWWC